MMLNMIIKEAVAASFFISFTLGILFGLLQTDYPYKALQYTANKLIKEEPEAEPNGFVCDKSFDKVFETCRRGLVDDYYELYTKNKEAVTSHCDDIATALTCKEI